MEDFEKRLTALETQVAEGAAKNGILEQQVAKLSAENDGLKKDLAKAAKGETTTSVGKVKEAVKVTIPETPFTVGKQKYRFNCAAFVNAQGQTINATEALADKELLASIVKEYPGVVTDPLIELFNGYKKIIADEITATNLTPVAVSGGAWTTSNVISTLETMWGGLHDGLKGGEVNVYCSYALYTLYNQAYREAYGKYTDQSQNGRTKLDFANAYLTPVPGLTGSNRVIMTPAWNLHYGYDLASDKDSFEFEQNKRVMDFWLDYKIGVQIGIVRNDHIRVNDLV